MTYSERIQSDPNSNDLQGLGFSLLALHAQLADHIASIQKDYFPWRALAVGTRVSALLFLLSYAYLYTRWNTQHIAGEFTQFTAYRDRDRASQSANFFSITTDAKGVTQQKTADYFDHFYRADTSDKLASTGLALSLARAIINIHRRHIEIPRKLGCGTAVTLWLPELLVS
jgi:hypothetical protein